MKFKTTKKAVMNGYSTVISVRNGLLFNLSRHYNAVAYTTRVEGWGADVYVFGDTAIVTGYAPFGNINADFETCQKYEKLAIDIYHNDDIECDDKKIKNEELIYQFINEITALKVVGK